MRKISVVSMLCAMAIAPAAWADTLKQDEFCHSLGEIARVAMVHRQAGMSREASWQIFSRAPEGLNLKPIWDLAYNTPVYSGERSLVEINRAAEHYKTLCLQHPSAILTIMTQ